MGMPLFDLLGYAGQGLAAVLLVMAAPNDNAENAAVSHAANLLPAITKAMDSNMMVLLKKSTQRAGSPDLLRACWTPEQLRGSASDKSIKKPAPDPSPPERLSYRKQAILPEKLSGSIRYVKPRNSEKLVALTFDLCEQANEKSGYDADLINYLRDHQVKATFFAGGKWMRSHPEKTMQLMADPLFEIGNHA